MSWPGGNEIPPPIPIPDKITIFYLELELRDRMSRSKYEVFRKVEALATLKASTAKSKLHGGSFDLEMELERADCIIYIISNY
jgi:hypothetical protein